MCTIQSDDIAFICICDEDICLGCATAEELAAIEMDNVYTSEMLNEEDFHFCDRCKQQIRW